MGQVTQQRVPAFVARYADALREQLPGADVEAEKITGTNHYRFLVVSGRFNGRSHRERQQLVWSVADRVLTPDQRLRVTMIITLGPGELNGAGGASGD